MSQPDGAPPEKREQRRPENDSLRRLINGFQAELQFVTAELKSLEKRTVTHAALLTWACAFAVAVVGCVWMLLGKSETSIKASAAEYREAVKDEIGRLREDNLETRRDVKALYQSQPKRRRQDRLEKPLELDDE